MHVRNLKIELVMESPLLALQLMLLLGLLLLPYHQQTGLMRCYERMIPSPSKRLMLNEMMIPLLRLMMMICHAQINHQFPLPILQVIPFQLHP